MPQTAPYGTWKSPITADSITGSSISLSDVLVDSATSIVYHLEGRPAEEGRTAIVDTNATKDLIPGLNATTSVHEYGGGAAIVRDRKLYFSNIRVDQDSKDKFFQIFQVDLAGGQTKPVTVENKVYRFASFDIHPTVPHLLVAVLEDHTNDAPAAVINTLCLIDINSGKVVPKLVSGLDFYALPKFSPDGKRLAWQQWSHPDMPWEGSNICVADVQLSGDFLRLSNTTVVAGEKGKVSVGYIEWASKDVLLFLSDISGFSNPWKYANGKASPILPQPVEEDFSDCMWNLSSFPYALVDELGKKAVFMSFQNGRATFSLIDLESGDRKKLESPYVTVNYMRKVSGSKNQFVFVGEKIDEGETVALGQISGIDSASPSLSFTTLKPNENSSIYPKDLVSKSQGISLKTAPSDLLHIVYYPPHNPDYSGSSIGGEKPPCIVNTHGGPTSMATQGLRWGIQYYTSRGFAWLDVNYGGSSGYGRTYRDRLKGQWGLTDVEDAIKASKVLSSAPYDYFDPKRIVIRGGSAGGLTTLAALCHASDLKTFAAGTSLYGISNLVLLAETTHKFESQYMYKLLGGTYEEVPDHYTDRSPINHVESFQTPLLLLQGDQDRVVPPSQAEAIYKGIKKRHGDVELQVYKGEGHGFRQQDHLKDALERERSFYERVLNLPVVHVL